MKWGVVIGGYFVVAAVFFVAGRLTADRSGTREVPGPVDTQQGSSVVRPTKQDDDRGGSEPAKPVRVDSIESKPVARPTPDTTARREDPSIPPGTRPADDASPSHGPKDARVIVIEISDFQCPVCKRAHEPLKRLVADFPGQVRVVFKHNPLQMHRNALNAAAASMAAARQGRFFEYADRLFQNQSALSEQDLRRYASEMGLDMDRFDKDFRDPSIRARALAEGEAAMRLGARGTPAFFVNGRMQVGWASYESIRQMVQQEIEAVNRLVSSGKSVKDARLERVKASLEDPKGLLESPLGREFAEP